MKISYNQYGYASFTPCPCQYDGPMVGSAKCAECGHFVSDNEQENYIECNGEIYAGETLEQSLSGLMDDLYGTGD